MSTWSPAREAPDQEFTYIDLSAVDQDTKEIVEPRKLFGRDAPSRARQLVASDDVLVSTVRPNLNGVAHVPRALDGGTASTGFCVLRPIPARIDGRYLFHWVQTDTFVREMVRLATGASYPAVSDRVVLDSVIPLPPMAEQRRIAEVLDRAEVLRTQRRASLAQLDALARAAFDDWFGDPVANTKGWPVEALGDLCRVIRGASPRPAGDPRYFGGGIPWLKISDVTAAQGKTVEHIRETVTEAGRDRSVYLEAGSLILTNSATVGIPKFLGVGACIHDGFLAFLDIETRVEGDFLYMLLLMLRSHLASLAPEGTQKNLNTGLAKRLPIILPPLERQRRFGRLLAEIEGNRCLQMRHASEIDALVTSVQHRAFSGGL